MISFQRLGYAAIALTLLAGLFILANAEPRGRIFWHLLTVHDGPATGIMFLAIVSGLLAQRFWRQSGSWIERLVLLVDRKRFTVAAFLWVALAASTVLIYRNHPLSMDEYAAFFQARIFAEGKMHGQFPPDILDALIPRGFQNHFLMVNRTTGAVFSAYWPGFSLLLAPFVALGIPWACNPALVAGSFLLIGKVAREVVPGPQAPGWALLLALASPAFVVNGLSYYSMPAHLFFNLLFAWLLLSPTPLRLVLAGLVGGYALVLHNPFPHAVFAAPWIVWLAVRRERSWRDLGCLLLGYVPVVLCLGVGWMLWQQQMLQAGVSTLTDTAVTTAPTQLPDILERAVRLLSGLFRFLQLPGEDVAYARIGGLVKLWLWASPLLLLLAWQGARGERDWKLRLLAASALLTFFAYFAIRYDQGHGWGYRYFHSAWAVLPILAAAGIAKMTAAAPTSRPSLNGLAVATLAGLVAMNGMRLWQVDDFVTQQLAQSPPMRQEGRQLIFHFPGAYYGADLIQNDPWLRGRTLIMLSRDPVADASIAQRFLPAGYSVERNRYGTSYFTKAMP